MKRYCNLCLIIFLLLTWSCASSGEMADSGNISSDEYYEGKNRVSPHQDPALTLADYLIRIPGIVVTGEGPNAKVTIRGTSSFIAGTDPLYVIDGQVAGTEYSRVSAIVPVTSIARVEVLKGSDAAIYGIRGANGVILISTRR